MSSERFRTTQNQLQIEPSQTTQFDNREVIIKRVFDLVNTVDTNILISLANRLGFNNDSKRDEAVQYARDHVIELVAQPESHVNWDDFIANTALRVKIYRNALIDFNRRNPRKTYHIDDDSMLDEDRLVNDSHEQIVCTKLDLNKILEMVISGRGKTNAESREKFLIILRALLQGKSVKKIIAENNWDILSSRVTQIFQENAAILKKYYPNFPSSINELKGILDFELSEESKIKTAKHIIQTLRSEERRLSEKIKWGGKEQGQLKMRLISVRSMTGDEPEFSPKDNAMRQRIWQELFPDMVFIEWNQLIRKIVKTENL